MSYTFRWDKPASEVYVTGTFDNWSKSVQLDQDGSTFQKTVPLPSSQEKIYYKFVVDGEWTTSDAKSEADPGGNVNNYLVPDDLMSSSDSQSNPHISSVAPGASTTAMAGEQPMEEKRSQAAPGAFPETPANEEQTFSVAPIPASEGPGNPMQLAPGEKVPDSSANDTSIESGVHDDPELKSKAAKSEDSWDDQTMRVAPIPASGGLGNPIQLAPGEKVPDSREISNNTVESTAKMDQASYEKSDAGIQPLQPHPQSDPVAAGLGPQTSSQIPESSMGMGSDAPADINKEDTGPTISSVAPTSSTAAMAGQVPKEERREATVIDDKENAGPEADKKEESGNKGFIGTLSGAAFAVGAAAAGGAYAANETAKDKTGTDPKSTLPESTQKTIDDNALESTASIPQQTAAGEAPKVPKEENELNAVSSVPDEVTKSQKEAQFPPEAAASTEAVQEKKEVEAELLKKVPESEATGEPAPTDSAAAATTAPAATTTESSTTASGAPQLGDPTAGVAALSMDDKAKAGESTTAEPKETTQEDKPLDSRDVSPMSKTPTKQPEATKPTAAESTPTPRPQKETENSTPAKRQSIVDRIKGGSSGTPGSAKSGETTDSKKDKRRSFFGKIKDKLKG